MERGQLVPVSRRNQASGGRVVCWAPHGFASQVRAAHVFFRCPPGRDGDGPENRGWEPPGWEVPSRPGWGGGGEALLDTGGGQYSVIAGGARGTAPASLLLRLQELGGAVWGGRTGQGRHLSEPLVMGCHRLAFGPVRRRHCLPELMKWPGTREKLARHRLVVISVSAVGSRVERGAVSPQCRLASLAWSR